MSRILGVTFAAAVVITCAAAMLPQSEAVAAPRNQCAMELRAKSASALSLELRCPFSLTYVYAVADKTITKVQAKPKLRGATAEASPIRCEKRKRLVFRCEGSDSGTTGATLVSGYSTEARACETKLRVSVSGGTECGPGPGSCPKVLRKEERTLTPVNC